MEENLTQSRKGRGETRKSRKKRKNVRKGDLKFGKRTFTAALWID
jgi:hypothetical protein